MPQRMAPAVMAGLTPQPRAMVISTTPMVLAVPKAVPMRKLMAAHSKKAHRMNSLG